MDERGFDRRQVRMMDGDYSKYSPDFQKMIADHGMTTLLRDCHFEGSFVDWEKDRRPSATFISKPGSIIDFGCANGFLIKCLEEWSKQKLNAYGVDADAGSVERARNLFGDFSGERFVVLSESDMQLPMRFDYAYWNVWDNADLDHPHIRKVIEWLRERTAGGRIILGLYHEEAEENERKLRWFDEHGYVACEVIRTESGLIFAAIDVPLFEHEI